MKQKKNDTVTGIFATTFFQRSLSKPAYQLSTHYRKTFSRGNKSFVNPASNQPNCNWPNYTDRVKFLLDKMYIEIVQS